ncbi:MAG: efflux RND transporter periplasmic adaptor subunit [Rhodocyclaceae bacterium]|nr:efflux RND transporter periplasmic adaptor subunit [Rhodocyclaceae bacterium]
MAGVVLILAATLVGAAGWTSRPLSELAVYPGFSVPARVEARDEARIAAEVGGRIEALEARVGQAVVKGAVLARLDDRALQIEVRRAQAALSLVDNRIRLAESQLARTERLAGESFVSEDALKVQRTELDVLHSEREASVQSLAAARLALEHAVIRAPFQGIVRERLASVGDLAAPGTPLLVLSAAVGPEVRASVPLAQLEALRQANSPVLVAGGRSVPVTIRRVSELVEAAGQTREVVLGTDQPVAPGLAGELRWQARRPHLPPEFLQTREGRLGAYVLESGQPVFRPLPIAQPGRPVPVDWALETPVIDEGRLGVGLEAGAGR